MQTRWKSNETHGLNFSTKKINNANTISIRFHSQRANTPSQRLSVSVTQLNNNSNNKQPRSITVYLFLIGLFWRNIFTKQCQTSVARVGKLIKCPQSCRSPLPPHCTLSRRHTTTLKQYSTLRTAPKVQRTDRHLKF